MTSLRKAAILIALVLVTTLATAQVPGLGSAPRHELSVLGGGYFPASFTSLDLSAGFALQGAYAGRLAQIPGAALYLEVPVTGTLQSDLSTALANIGSVVRPQNYSALYVTPGLRLKLVPRFPVSPYFMIGVGLAHFRTTGQTSTGSSADSTNNHAALDFGGGLDVHLLPFIALRGEVRDFYTGAPSFTGIPGLGGSDNNIFVGAGIVLRF